MTQAVAARTGRPVVVAGIGNPYRRDDGAGVAVAARLAAGSGPFVRDVGPVTEPLDLLGRWDDAELAVVVDAVRSSQPPGTLEVVDLDSVAIGPATASATSSHGVDTSGVLRIARALGRGPRRVVLVGVAGADFGQGPGLSPAVEAAVPRAVDAVRRLLEEASVCVSRLHQVVAVGGDDTVDVADLDGAVHQVSLLAFSGPRPEPGDWIVAHSGYALEPADPVEAQAVLAEYSRARDSAGEGGHPGP